MAKAEDLQKSVTIIVDVIARKVKVLINETIIASGIIYDVDNFYLYYEDRESGQSVKVVREHDLYLDEE